MGLTALTESAPRLGTLGSPGDDTPSQEPPRLLMQEGGGSSEVKQPDLMGLVGSVRVIFCSSGICSHLKCRLQSNPTGKAGRGWVQEEPVEGSGPYPPPFCLFWPEQGGRSYCSITHMKTCAYLTCCRPTNHTNTTKCMMCAQRSAVLKMKSDEVSVSYYGQLARPTHGLVFFD